jgi:hypothetical protein
VVDRVIASMEPGVVYASFVKAAACAFMDATSPTVKHAVVSTPVSLMAVSLKQRRGTPSARHAFLLRKDFHDAAKYEWQHSWKRGSRTDCCRCLRFGTDRIQQQILFSAGHIGQILDMSWTYSNV